MAKATARKQVTVTPVVARRPKINPDAPESNSGAPDDDEQEQEEVEVVTAILPNPLRLTLDDGSVHDYPKGTQKLPRDHAEHWFAQARGVTIVGDDE